MIPEDLLAQRNLSDAQISPSGSRIAFVVSDNFKEENTARPKSNVWIADARNDSVFQFSRGSSADFLPRWSPDEEKLAFLSDREGNGYVQLYVLPFDGGEARRLTNVKSEISQIQWSKDGMRLACLIYDQESDETKSRFEKSGGATEFEKHHRFARIHLINAKTGSDEVVTTGNYHIWEFDWSHDEKSFAAIVADEPYEWSWHISKLAVIPVGDSRPRIVYDPRPRQLGRVLWSPDGDFIYFISATWSDRGLIAGDLFRVRSSGSELKAANVSEDRLGSVHYFDWLPSNELMVLSVDHTKTKFTRFEPSKETWSVLYEGDVALGDLWQPRFSLTRGASGAIAVVREDLQSPLELYRGDLGSDGQIVWKKMTSLNGGLAGYPTRTELVQWESFDGLKIQGFLYLPDKKRDGGFPLIVREHGGPSLAYGHKYEMEARYFASHGYATLLPNPRGSAGRGVRFLEMNRGNIEGDDFKDIMTGVEYCLSRGIADPKNLFVYGGSYGGYLVAWTVTHSDRFNAAVMDFGISNLLSCHGGEWNTYWEVFQFDIDPYRTRDLYEKKSPLYFVEKARTPTLIIHGKEDPCVPVAQSYEFFRALKELGIETELVVYPREGHGWMEKKHKIDAWQRHLAWFDGHMKNGLAGTGEAKSKATP